MELAFPRPLSPACVRGPVSAPSRGPFKLTQTVLVNLSCVCHVSVIAALLCRWGQPKARSSRLPRSTSSARIAVRFMSGQS
jgi:hypothetical protein